MARNIPPDQVTKVYDVVSIVFVFKLCQGFAYCFMGGAKWQSCWWCKCWNIAWLHQLAPFFVQMSSFMPAVVM